VIMSYVFVGFWALWMFVAFMIGFMSAIIE
jgi:hypothetical protein